MKFLFELFLYVSSVLICVFGAVSLAQNSAPDSTKVPIPAVTPCKRAVTVDTAHAYWSTEAQCAPLNNTNQRTYCNTGDISIGEAWNADAGGTIKCQLYCAPIIFDLSKCT